MINKEYRLNKIYESIERNKFILPNIQRGFRWYDEKKITNLFDSLMQGYPVGMLLLWELDEQKSSGIDFYEFTKSYDKSQKNDLISKKIEKVNELYAVLDGQQRITSIYFALQSSYSFNGKNLYLNISKTNNDTEEDEVSEDLPKYIFKFFTEKEVEKYYKEADVEKSDDIKNDIIKCNDDYYIRVGLILDKDLNFKIENSLEVFDIEKRKKLKETIAKLHYMLTRTEIPYYEIDKNKTLDEVLQIFVRVNSGGVKLEKADLLFSALIANNNDINKETISKLLKEIDISNIDKDVIIRVFLTIFCAKGVTYNYNNFNSILPSIKEHFEKVKDVIITSAEFLKISCFYNNEKQLSVYPLIVVSYIIYKLSLKKGSFDNRVFKDIVDILTKPQKQEHCLKKSLVDFVIKSLFLGLYSGSSDSTLRQVREAINEMLEKNNDYKTFSIDYEILNQKLTRKSMIINYEQLESYLDKINYGDNNKIYYIFTLLMPNYKPESYRYNIDHIYPKSWFEKTNDKELEKKGNSIYNLVPLAENLNKSKNDRMPNDWFDDFSDKIQARNDFIIPEDIDLNVENFDNFLKKRKAMILENLLGKLVKA
ncbi:DUF262 domain-containing protein [Campylobacter sp. 2018MI01]|uniref:DUF262 domain-containing protein n=1 Tax=Campylobacter sp. 2018MI01 TaxID=2836735 RepID=UPI001BDA9DCD|nr:DUF262 domain-containing protein [Campylobacter sp. 2018MI01]MBT0878809.1 DUF262 domain-containing protein [Campylobacter sp. 2018MI01]